MFHGFAMSIEFGRQQNKSAEERTLMYTPTEEHGTTDAVSWYPVMTSLELEPRLSGSTAPERLVALLKPHKAVGIPAATMRTKDRR